MHCGIVCLVLPQTLFQFIAFSIRVSKQLGAMRDFEFSAFDKSVGILEGILQSIPMRLLGIQLGFNRFVNSVLVVESLLETCHQFAKPQVLFFHRISNNIFEFPCLPMTLLCNGQCLWLHCCGHCSRTNPVNVGTKITREAFAGRFAVDLAMTLWHQTEI